MAPAAMAPAAAPPPQLEAAVRSLVAEWSQQQRPLPPAPREPAAAPRAPPASAPWSPMPPILPPILPPMPPILPPMLPAVLPAAASNVLASAKLRLAAGRVRRRRLSPAPQATWTGL